MALGTIGTNAATSLAALRWLPGYNSGVAPADMASLALMIKDDLGNAHALWPEAFSYNGHLFIPNREGMLHARPGDVIAVDAATGWPIIISKNAAANGPWTTTV